MEKVLQINSADSQEFRQLLADVRTIKRQLEERSNSNSITQRHYRGEPIITKFEYLSRVNKGNTWFSSRKKQIRHFTHKDGSVWVFESEVDKYFEGHF